jgi:hypothetical protein
VAQRRGAVLLIAAMLQGSRTTGIKQRFPS